MQKRLIHISLFLFFLLTSLALAELILRSLHYKPMQAVETNRNVDVALSDAVLGWTLRPGIHHEFIDADRSIQVTYTILPDGERKSADNYRHDPAHDPQVFLIGDSFTQGVGVNDDETFASQLQRLQPGLAIHNYGVMGYGTLQSLLMLKRRLYTGHPATVIYGYIVDHESRNVATLPWVYGLASLTTARIRMPYIKQFHSPDQLETGYLLIPALPWRDHLALIGLLETLYLQAVARNPYDHDTQVLARTSTLSLIREMQAVTIAAHARFILVILLANPGTLQDYQAQLADVTVLPCNVDLNAPGMRVPFNGHPSALAHRQYAACINQALRNPVPGTASTGTSHNRADR